ncbi:MFS transporter [Actinokineospora auranticolor]|uniref:DHA1 family multidrug resistance protein B-like MFS transporter n=1 Tax=Actinokineospora auranticolor TaxID=155976 RepID=A0A2S6GKA0_9PSEU|nr:MFS transporter [Actinokineospora auranticolor]PPK65662.1 DHA1 family multidrug resistance protein B-like MFS transporter [Actinokineospora auranticolor]
MNLKDLHPSLRIRVGVGFVNRLVDSMITSFMAIHLALTFGVAAAGGLLIAVIALGVVGMLVGGHVADLHGRRRTLLVAEAAAAVTFALMAVAEGAGDGAVDSSLLVYLGYLANKFAASVALPANDAMIVDLSTPEIRKGVYTVNFWATNLALAIGALLGAALYSAHFALVLGLAAAATAGVLATTYFLIAETKPDTDTDRVRPPGVAAALREFGAGYRLVLRDKVFLKLMIAGTLTLAVEFQLVNHIAVRLAAGFPSQALLPVGWSPVVDGVGMLGVLRAENTILVVVLALFSTTLLRRVSDRTGLYLGTALFVGGYAVLAVSGTGWLLMVAGLVFTIGELMSVPVKQALLANLVPDHSRTRYMAVYNLNIRVAQGLAAACVTLGAVVPAWGMAALYLALGAVIIAQYRSVLAAQSAPAPLARA